MFRRPNRRFSGLFAAGPGAHIRAGRRGVSYLEKVPFSQSCSAEDLAYICRWAGLSHPRLAGIGRKALRRLLSVAAQRRPTNHYHHAGHFAHVVIAAGLLAYEAGLSARERALLVLAALVHDLDHAGRYAAHHLFAQETASARRAMRIILGSGGDARLSLRLLWLLKATALTFHGDRKAILAGDRLARLLADADLFSSLFFSRRKAIQLTRGLNLEMSKTGDPAAHYDAFMESMLRMGAHSAAGRSLLAGKSGSEQIPGYTDREPEPQ